VTDDGTSTCTFSSAGSGGSFYWRVIVGGQDSEYVYLPRSSYSSPNIISYRREVDVSVIDPSVLMMDTRGHETMVITGKNFGPLGSPIEASMQAPVGPPFVPFNCTITVPHFEITCLTAPGAGGSIIWQIIVDGLVSRQPSTGFAPPVIYGITIQDDQGATLSQLSTSGNETLVITGDNFGIPDSEDLYLNSVTYGTRGFGYNAQDCKVVSPSVITCKSSPGVGSKLFFQVTVFNQTNDLSNDALLSVSYRTPVITSMTPVNLQTVGGSFIYIT
jgi:hypothetical protein